MSNYQRYQPRRRTYQSSTRRWGVIGWGVAILVVVILAWNGIFGGSGGKKSEENRNAEITLAGTNGGSNQNVNASPTVDGREFAVRDCTRAVSSVTTDKPYVALTLNAGGIAGDSQALVEVLKQNNIPAALFATGPWAEENPEIVNAYVSNGIDVYSRGYSRTAYSTLTATQVATDLKKAEAALSDAGVTSSRPFVRPPGDVTSGVLSSLTANGVCPILWTVDALDIQSDATVESSVTRVTKALKNGAIILMGANSDLALELAPAIATAVKDEGYTLVPLHDLLRVTGSSTVNANSNSNANRNTNSSD